MDSEDKKDIINKIETPQGDTGGEAEVDAEIDIDAEVPNEPTGNDEEEVKGELEEAPTGDTDSGFNYDDFYGEFNNDSLSESDDFMLSNPKKLSIFAPKGSSEMDGIIKNKLKEVKKLYEYDAPEVAPVTKPDVESPDKKIKRRDKPFSPKIDPSIKPAPKFKNDNGG